VEMGKKKTEVTLYIFMRPHWRLF